MKRIILLLAIILTFSSSLKSAEINGRMEDFNGIKTLYVWGTHQERGFAIGYYCAEDFYTVFKDYFFAELFSGNTILYNNLKAQAKFLIGVEDYYIEEAQGILDGIKEAGWDDEFYEIFGRDFDTFDIIIANSVPDLAARFGCSSVSSWGESTKDDPELQGELVITRLLDWSSSTVLVNSQLMIVHIPASRSEQAWVNFTFSGLMGSVSGINAGGVCAFHHMGNDHGNIPSQQAHPSMLTLRNGLEIWDANGDNEVKSSDVYYAFNEKVQAGGFIIHTASALANQDSAIILECNPDHGVVVRTIDDNTEIEGTNLVTTNHFRKMIAPEDCDRFDRLMDSLSSDSDMTVERSWNMLGQACGADGTYWSYTIHEVEYIPYLRKVKLGMATPELPGCMVTPIEFNLDDLFNVNGIEDQETSDINGILISPNPVDNLAIISLSEEINGTCSMNIFNINGEKVYSSDSYYSGNNIIADLSNLTSGVYICNILISNNNGKTTSFSRKLIKN